LETAQKSKILAAFQAGELKVRSVSPQGEEAWKRVLEVQRTKIGVESVVEVTTRQGSAVLTAGHRVFISPTTKVEAGKLAPDTQVVGAKVVSTCKLSSREFMYDLTAEDWHNFFLHRSGMLVSNSPDRNYHFRPPAHEETIRQFNQVFGFIWTDEELKEYIERAIDMISAAPPRTVFQNCDQFVNCRPEWRTLLLNGAMMHALMAIMINWISDEFSLSGETQVRVRTPEGTESNLSMEELYSICYDDTEIRNRIRTAFREGTLEVQSVDSGVVAWKKLSDVLKHQTGHKRAFQVNTQSGSSVTATEDHSLFIFREGSIEETRTDGLKVGDPLAVVSESGLASDPILSIEEASPLEESYDLSVPGPENFVLSNGIVAHNSYNIGGVSLEIEKSSKYESAYGAIKDSWDSQLERAKQTVKIIKGLQQPRFGIGIRSSFGPFTGRGTLTPQKFVGF